MTGEAPDWAFIYSHIQTSSGVSPRDIDEMEYSEVEGLFDYWKQNPPTHLMVQGFFKMGGKSEQTPKNEMTEEQFRELTSMFPQ